MWRTDEGTQNARKLSQKTLDEQEQQVKAREKQIKRPWQREGADKPPVTDEREDKIKPMTKGSTHESLNSILIYSSI